MKRLLFVFYLLLFVLPVFSQAPVFQGEKEKYILVNGEPYLALINGKGKILKLIREAPEILKHLSSRDKKELKEYYSVRKTAPFNPNQYNRETNASAESFTSDEYLAFGFSEFRARLNDVQVNQLQALANQYKSGAYSTIAVKSIMFENGDNGIELANNRAAACADLLKVFGVPESALSIDLIRAPNPRPEVKIFVQ